MEMVSREDGSRQHSEQVQPLCCVGVLVTCPCELMGLPLGASVGGDAWNLDADEGSAPTCTYRASQERLACGGAPALPTAGLPRVLWGQREEVGYRGLSFPLFALFYRSTNISRLIPCEDPIPWGGEVQVEEQVWGYAQPRGPWLPAENRVRGTRHSAPGTSGARAAAGFQQRRAWSCVAGDGLRAALGPQLPAAAAAQREGAARGGAPRDPGALSAPIGVRAPPTRFIHHSVRQRKNKEQRKRISLPRVFCC